MSCVLYYRMLCITINISEPQNPRFILKSDFKSRVGYNGVLLLNNFRFEFQILFHCAAENTT
jgi:hypothetical protein